MKYSKTIDLRGIHGELGENGYSQTTIDYDSTTGNFSYSVGYTNLYYPYYYMVNENSTEEAAE